MLGHSGFSACNVPGVRPLSLLLFVQVQPTTKGALFSLPAEKAYKWVAIIDDALLRMHLDSGSAQKLAGRLMWGTQLIFYRLGRAMIKANFFQKGSATGRISPWLLSALKWCAHFAFLLCIACVLSLPIAAGGVTF